MPTINKNDILHALKEEVKNWINKPTDFNKKDILNIIKEEAVGYFEDNSYMKGDLYTIIAITPYGKYTVDNVNLSNPNEALSWVLDTYTEDEIEDKLNVDFNQIEWKAIPADQSDLSENAGNLEKIASRVYQAINQRDLQSVKEEFDSFYGYVKEYLAGMQQGLGETARLSPQMYDRDKKKKIKEESGEDYYDDFSQPSFDDKMKDLDNSTANRMKFAKVMGSMYPNMPIDQIMKAWKALVGG